MKVKIMILVALLGFFLVGCSTESMEKLQKGVIDNNQRVDNALTSYDKAKETGKLVEEAFLAGVKTRDGTIIDNHEVLKGNAQVVTGVGYGLRSFNESIYTYIETHNEEEAFKKLEDETYEEDIIEDVDAFIEEVIEVRYFLDDETGKVEQMFLLQLPYGVTAGVSVFWVGGSPFEYKTFGSI